MSFKEVKELRKSGKLDEALTLAKLTLQEAPDDIWAKRGLAWVHYDYIKLNAAPEKYDKLKEHLLALKQLNLPEEEVMVFDQLAFQIGKLLFTIKDPGKLSESAVNLDELFEIIKGFHFTKPSESYTFLYRSFHRFNKVWMGYLDFADWWDFKNFQSVDFLPSEFNGKKVMAVVEQAYVGYARKIIADTAVSRGRVFVFINDPMACIKVEPFIVKLEALVNDHPEFQYPPYYLAKLYIASAEQSNKALEVFLPFAKKKQNDFWVWDMLADQFAESDKDKYLACLCKAASLKSPEDFLIKVRQKLAHALVERELFLQAKTEIEKVLKVRQVHEWKIPAEIQGWMNEEWYTSTESNKSNSEFYKEHTPLAEEILYSDREEELVVVEFVNTNKQMLTFISEVKESGFFNYSAFIKKPKIGDVLRVRLEAVGKDGFHKALTVKNTNEQLPYMIKQFNGEVRLVAGKNFGFVQDIFIDARIVEKYGLVDGKAVMGKAITSYDKKKGTWGWKGFEIDLLANNQKP